MHTLRRLAVLAVSACTASAFLTGPARADTPEVFQGRATGTALHLNGLGVDVTLGQSLAQVQLLKVLEAKASGAGALAVLGTHTAAEVTGLGSDAKPMACGAVLPVVNLLSAGLGCSTSTATITPTSSLAHSEGTVASIDVTAGSPLKAITDTVNVGATLQNTLTQVAGLVGQATGTNVVLNATDTLTTLLSDLTTTKTLSVALGKSTSDVASSAAQVTSAATDQGGEIDLLPVGALGNVPVAAIRIGSADAKVVYDRITGKSTPTFDPALVTVDTAPLAGLGAQHLSIAPGHHVELFAGTPLDSTIDVANGSSFTDATGALHAVANGVSLRLLKGIPAATLALDLARAEAVGGGAPAVVAPAVVPAGPHPAAPLPRTGGTPWLPLAGGALAAAALAARRLSLIRR